MGNRLAWICGVGLLGAAGMAAAVAPARFDSAYTTLATACVEAPGTSAEEGQDPWLSCAGPSGHYLYLSFSAADTMLNAGPAASPDTQWLEGSIPGIDQQKGVVEWRLADGQPIALIVRSTPIEFDDEGMPKSGKVQTLEIRGLGVLAGFEAGIDARATPRANEAARARVEQEYHQRIKH